MTELPPKGKLDELTFITGFIALPDSDYCHPDKLSGLYV